MQHHNLHTHYLQGSLPDPGGLSFDSDATIDTPGVRQPGTPPGHLQRFRLQRRPPGGLKQLTSVEADALSKDVQVNATMHSFMRLFVDSTGAPLPLGVSERHLLNRMHASGYSNLSAVGIQYFIGKAISYGIIKKLVSKVSHGSCFLC